MKFRYSWVLAVLVLCTGCGRAERKEAVTFGRFLTAQTASFMATNTMEKDALEGARLWCDGITANGSGHGKDLQQNADSAKSLADSISLVSTQLGQLRQTIYDQPLKTDELQTIRGKLISDIMKRQRMLQDVRTALAGAASGFLDFRESRAYTGDTYPAGIDKLNSMLKSYHGPEDLLGSTLTELKTTYKLQSAELGPGGPTT